MILIITNSNDLTTNEVVKWLILLKKKFIRTNNNEIFKIKVKEKRIFLKGIQNEFYLDEISSVWYRRGSIRFYKESYNNVAVNRYMTETYYWLADFILKTLESKRHINKQSNSSVNKLWVLKIAKEVGLKVPSYFLSDNLNNVELGKTITKTLNEGGMILDYKDDMDALIYTTVVNKIKKTSFFPTFFQEKIKKDFDLRVFYLNKKIWSFAIISQNDKKTEVDFRRYNDERPNRIVKYELPKEVESKIRLIMRELDLNSGSLDFVRSNNEFYFLEINPIGQFGNFSLFCNVNLEKEIAKYL